MPRSEGQIRPLLTLPKAQRVDAWGQIVAEVAPPDVLTGPDVEVKVLEISGKKAPRRLSPKTRAQRALDALRATVGGLPGATEIGRRLDDVEGLIREAGRWERFPAHPRLTRPRASG
jgi:hypothetical protein